MYTKFCKALIYCRVSTLRQVREGSGLDSQEHRCRQYAAENNFIVERVFPDDGISGGLFDRPAMKELIRYLDENWQENYVVIFDDLKRFARDVDVHRGLKRELKDRGVRLCCLNYTFDDSPEGEFVETIFAAQNELERKQNRRQVCQKMKARIERGYWCFGPPTGYRYVKTKEHGKILTPVRPVTDIIAEGLTAFSESRFLTQRDLLLFFKQSRLAQLAHIKRLNYEYIKQLLTQPLYAGRIEYAPWGIPLRKGMHKPIITEEVFEKNQERLRRPPRKPRTTDTIEFPLRRIINCAVCGRPMTGSSCRGKNPNRYFPYYTCNNTDCTASPKNITASLVESQYVALLESIKADREILNLAKISAQCAWQRRSRMFDQVREEQKRKVHEINSQIRKYVELIPDCQSNTIRLLYESKIDELSSQLRALEKDRNETTRPNFDEALALALAFLGTPAQCWEKADLNGKQALHRLIFVENLTYSKKDGFGTPILSLPFHINTPVYYQKDILVDPSSNFWNTFIDHLFEWHSVLKAFIKTDE